MNRTFEAGPLSTVDGLPDGGRWTLVFVRELRHEPQKVWSALTDPEQLARWAPYTADRDLGATGAATLTMIDGLSREDLAAQVGRAEPPRLLEYTWGPTDVLRWELEPTDAGTRLTLKHTVEDRDQMSKVAAGWHLCLRVAEEMLAGTPIPPIRGDEAREYGWEQLNEQYAAELGRSDGR